MAGELGLERGRSCQHAASNFVLCPGIFSADRHLEIANLKKKTGVKIPYFQTDPNNRRIPIIDD